MAAPAAAHDHLLAQALSWPVGCGDSIEFAMLRWIQAKIIAIGKLVEEAASR
jgi:hypothetical protein